MVHAPYIDHPDDDDCGHAGTLVRDVLDDDGRARLVTNVSGHLLNGVSEPVMARAFIYWGNIDAELGKAIRESVGTQHPDSAPSTSQGATTVSDDTATV